MCLHAHYTLSLTSNYFQGTLVFMRFEHQLHRDRNNWIYPHGV